MFTIETLRRYAAFGVCLILFNKTCLGVKELNAQEGKDFTITCSGRSTDKLKHIWWTSKQMYVSTCYIGDGPCVNYEGNNYTATISVKHQKYISILTIHNVSSAHRDTIFNCADNGNGHTQTFLLRVYHVPESTSCAAEPLSRGRINVTCQTLKVFPTIICEILQASYNVTDVEDYQNEVRNVQYNIYSKDGAVKYNRATCSAIICAGLPGSYRFKVKMYPNITYNLVTSVDGYTNIVTIQSSEHECVERKLVGEDVKAENQTMPTIKLKPIIGEESCRFRSAQHIFSYEGSQDLTLKTNQMLHVLLLLTCLLACSSFCNILCTVFKVRCSGRKIKENDPDFV